MSGGRGDTARLFFALWPDRAEARALHEAGRALQGASGGRLSRRETLHLTLAFLGDTPLARLPELESLAGAVRLPPFTFTLARYGWWKHNRIAWAMPEEPSVPLAVLAAALGEGLRERSVPFDAKPFVPHVTLVRRAERAPGALALPAVRWAAREFVLVRSRLDGAGAAYETLGRWPLAE